MVTPCINNIQHFNNQLTHTTLRRVELLKTFLKISKTAPTCFGLQGNHHQGATISTLLKNTHLVKSRYVEAVQDVVSVMAAYCDRSQHAAITLTTSCTASTYLLLTKCVIFSKVLIVAPWWWFPCKPKHVGAVLLIFKNVLITLLFLTLCASVGY